MFRAPVLELRLTVMPPEQRLGAEPIESLGDILGIRKDIEWR